MIILLCIIGAYLACGVLYTLWVVAHDGWDLGEGWMSNWAAYLFSILLWWKWLYLYLKR